jgi:hypothetical protein
MRKNWDMVSIAPHKRTTKRLPNYPRFYHGGHLAAPPTEAPHWASGETGACAPAPPVPPENGGGPPLPAARGEEGERRVCGFPRVFGASSSSSRSCGGGIPHWWVGPRDEWPYGAEPISYRRVGDLARVGGDAYGR